MSSEWCSGVGDRSVAFNLSRKADLKRYLSHHYCCWPPRDTLLHISLLSG